MKTSVFLHRQRGLTMIATILIMCFIGFLLLVAFKVVPIYLDYFNARKAIEGVSTDMSITNTPADVRRSLERRWAIDYITVINYRDIKVYKKGGVLMLDLSYEDRRPLFFNLDIVATFHEPVQLAP